MRLLMTIQYYKILFGKGAEISKLIEAFDNAKIVEEQGRYGEPKRYIPKTDVDIDLTIIADDNIMLPENSDDGLFEKFHKIAAERDELIKKVKELEGKIKVFTEATNSITEKK